MLNLWELLTASAATAPPHKKKRIEEAISDLSNRGAYGQELSIGTTERGWVLKVHSCYADWEVVILVPHDARLPVEIVTDTRGETENVS
jgi:hypothetical protein